MDSAKDGRFCRGAACEDVNRLKEETGQLRMELRRFAGLLDRERRLRRVAEEKALVDPLTGAFNKRGLGQKFDGELSKVRRFGRGLCLIFFDVDNFKAFNSLHGQRAGDLVLSGVIECVRANLRPYDTVHRIGGEEFVVLLPETDSLGNAIIVAERLREKIEGTEIPYGGKTLCVSVSMGVAKFQERGGLQDLIHHANLAEMGAKGAGKNRVFAFSESGVVPAEEYVKGGA